jgi:hypothetical protein
MAHKQLLQEWIQAAMPESNADVPLSLLYRGSRDGYEADDFHAKCDDAPATVTLVKSTSGFIFGGFSDKSWRVTTPGSIWKCSTRAFLFSFVSPSGYGPVKLPLRDDCDQPCAELYCGCYSTCGPTFRNKYEFADLRIGNNSNTEDACCSHLGKRYFLPPGQISETFLAGSEYFKVAEIEVFSVP